MFSYLSTDELEKLKAEEEKKIANISMVEVNAALSNTSDRSDNESVDSQRIGYVIVDLSTEGEKCLTNSIRS